MLADEDAGNSRAVSEDVFPGEAAAAELEATVGLYTHLESHRPELQAVAEGGRGRDVARPGLPDVPQGSTDRARSQLGPAALDDGPGIILDVEAEQTRVLRGRPGRVSGDGAKPAAGQLICLLAGVPGARGTQAGTPIHGDKMVPVSPSKNTPGSSER